MIGVNVVDHGLEFGLGAAGGEVGDLRLECADEVGRGVDDAAAEVIRAVLRPASSCGKRVGLGSSPTQSMEPAFCQRSLAISVNFMGCLPKVVVDRLYLNKFFRTAAVPEELRYARRSGFRRGATSKTPCHQEDCEDDHTQTVHRGRRPHDGRRNCAAIAYESRWPKKPSVPTDLNAEEFFTELAEKGSGFVVGNEKADTVVMMTFDTQCRWCVWEYEQVKPFLDRVKFVWHPVAVLNPWSELQGAAILAAKDPKAMFLEHEAHMKDAVFKGLDVRKMEIPFEKREAVWTNTKVFRRAAAREVPFGVHEARRQLCRRLRADG